MSIWCWLGLHRWVYKDEHEHGYFDTFARCTRPCCTRYPAWTLVNSEPVEVYGSEQPADVRKLAS